MYFCVIIFPRFLHTLLHTGHTLTTGSKLSIIKALLHFAEAD